MFISVACFHISFKVRRYPSALFILNLVIVACGSRLLVWLFIFITQWSLLRSLFEMFHDRMGGTEGDTIVRSAVTLKYQLLLRVIRHSLG